MLPRNNADVTHCEKNMFCFQSKAVYRAEDRPADDRLKIYPIHTEIFAPKINEINFIPVRDCWLLIGRTVFVTSEKYRPTNHRPRTALCH